MIYNDPVKKPKPPIIVLKPGGNRKTTYVRAANSENTTLAAWMFEKCDAASGYKEESENERTLRYFVTCNSPMKEKP